LTLQRLSNWTPHQSQEFEFRERSLDFNNRTIKLVYALDQFEFVEQLRLPPAAELNSIPPPGLDAALDLLHWIAGISYWKAGCPAHLHFATSGPDARQATWLTRVYAEGLAEFAFRNRLAIGQRLNFPIVRSEDRPPAGASGLRRRTLVPMGGGKDSLVAWSRLAALNEEMATVQIGSSPLIAALGERLPGRHWRIERRLDPRLIELNAKGAYNGHVPMTAINAAILVLACLLLDYDRVAFANERSAEEASRLDADGRPINHQFSKTFAFECLFDDWVRRYIDPSLRVFSLLRRDRELAVAREFASLEAFHDCFSSCNRNFHLDGPRTRRWCGSCPKCLFVYLILAPFLAPSRMLAIFGADLLADQAKASGFVELLALDGIKPFECVGEADEARAAVLALAGTAPWSDYPVVRELASRLGQRSVPSLEVLCCPGGSHRIPPEWVDAA